MCLGDIVHLVPDYHNKMDIAVKWVTKVLVSGAYKSYVYTILCSIKVCNSIMSKKSNVHTWLKSTLAKKC